MVDHTYFFQPEKKILKQGFFMTDEDKNVVYEAKMLKQPILGAMEFEFINHITGQSGVHKVGHTVTTETSGLFEFFSIKSSFKYDGENIWDYLHDQGIRIDSSIAGDRIGMSYHISLKGKDMADIATASPDGGNGLITGASWLKVTAAEEDIDLAFLTAFSIARTDQSFYD